MNYSLAGFKMTAIDPENGTYGTDAVNGTNVPPLVALSFY